MRDYADDPQRLSRLAEEVRGRLEEMAQIAARIGGIKLDPNSGRKFLPRSAPTPVADAGAGRAHVMMVEIFDATSDHPEMCVSWWSDGTVSLDSPCGHEIYHSHLFHRCQATVDLQHNGSFGSAVLHGSASTSVKLVIEIDIDQLPPPRVELGRILRYWGGSAKQLGLSVSP